MTTKHSFRTVEPFHNNDRHPQNAINLEIKNTQKQTCSQLFITFQHEKHIITLQCYTHNYEGT